MPSSAEARPSRHDRVWLDAATWRRHRRDVEEQVASIASRSGGTGSEQALHENSRGDGFVEDFIGEWIDRGRPLVARRRHVGWQADDCALAIASSPAQGRLRIPLVVARDAIVRIEPPLRIADVIAAAEPAHRTALQDLVVTAASRAVELRVYGSFAWQAMTGERYVTATSDLDLLFAARDAAHARVTASLLLAWERASGVRVDGEARFPNGDAVAWRELTTSAARVLVKRDDGVRLAPAFG